MPGPKNPGISFLCKGKVMLDIQRVISYPDGRVVVYYKDKEVIYREHEEPEEKSKVYNKKGIHGFLDRATDISSSIRSFGRY